MNIVKTYYEILEWQFHSKPEENEEITENWIAETENRFRAHQTDSKKALLEILCPILAISENHILQGKMNIKFFFDGLENNQLDTIRQAAINQKTWIEAAVTTLVNECMNDFAQKTSAGHFQSYVLYSNLNL